jgi:hypothetical protein
MKISAVQITTPALVNSLGDREKSQLRELGYDSKIIPRVHIWGNITGYSSGWYSRNVLGFSIGFRFK